MAFISGVKLDKVGESSVLIFCCTRPDDLDGPDTSSVGNLDVSLEDEPLSFVLIILIADDDDADDDDDAVVDGCVTTGGLHVMSVYC